MVGGRDSDAAVLTLKFTVKSRPCRWSSTPASLESADHTPKSAVIPSEVFWSVSAADAGLLGGCRQPDVQPARRSILCMGPPASGARSSVASTVVLSCGPHIESSEALGTLCALTRSEKVAGLQACVCFPALKILQHEAQPGLGGLVSESQRDVQPHQTACTGRGCSLPPCCWWHRRDRCPPLLGAAWVSAPGMFGGTGGQLALRAVEHTSPYPAGWPCAPILRQREAPGDAAIAFWWLCTSLSKHSKQSAVCKEECLLSLLCLANSQQLRRGGQRGVASPN